MIFNKRLKTDRGSTSISAVITGAVASIGLVATGVAVSTSIIPDDTDTSLSGVCVKAYYDNNEPITKTDCVYLNPQAKENGTGEEEDQSDSVYAVHSCGPHTLTIWQSEIDHSNKNKALLESGKADEMTAHPQGGWKVIVETDTAYPGFNTVALTVDGQLENASLLNNSGPATISSMGDEACLVTWSDGSLMRTIVESQGVIVREVYGDPVRDLPHRTDGPATQTYHPNGNPYYVVYSVNGQQHREDGPALIEYGELGEIKSIEWTVAGKEIKTREAWIETVGEEGGSVWDSYNK